MDIRKLAPGDRVLDYRILERLGEGGFGEVFRAEHEVLGRIVAIKVPRDQTGLTALRHEGVVQASLEHPNVVNTLELSISHDPPYIVMEYIDGDSLAELLRREGPLPWRKAARVLLEAARALQHAHKQGVIHGDVKPGNLLVEPGREGRVLLTDFGLGRVFEGPQGNLQISRSLELATSGAEVQGTIRYLAPELLRGETADERADIYSFGVLLFEAVTGRLPEGREVPSDLVKHLPDSFDEIFKSAFTRRERRPTSIDSIVRDLEHMVPEQAPRAATPIPAPVSVVRAIPADAPAPAAVVAPAVASSDEESRFESIRHDPTFNHWRAGYLAQLQRRMAGHSTIGQLEGRGFDTCYGVSAEGEPHHRVYALVLPKLDPAIARTVVSEARRVFDLEKGIWEKEVTFWIVADEVEDHDQVLWTFKSFSMGWWRRRRIVLQDVDKDRLYATELGCDPRGNPLKRAFLTASQESLRDYPPSAAEPVLATVGAGGPRRCLRGTAWGAALALLMTFGLLGSIMALDLASQRLRCTRAAVITVDATTSSCPGAVPSSTGSPGLVVTPQTCADVVGAAAGVGTVTSERPLPPRKPETFVPDEKPTKFF